MGGGDALAVREGLPFLVAVGEVELFCIVANRSSSSGAQVFAAANWSVHCEDVPPCLTLTWRTSSSSAGSVSSMGGS